MVITTAAPLNSPNDLFFNLERTNGAPQQTSQPQCPAPTYEGTPSRVPEPIQSVTGKAFAAKDLSFMFCLLPPLTDSQAVSLHSQVLCLTTHRAHQWPCCHTQPLQARSILHSLPPEHRYVMTLMTRRHMHHYSGHRNGNNGAHGKGRTTVSHKVLGPHNLGKFLGIIWLAKGFSISATLKK